MRSTAAVPLSESSYWTRTAFPSGETSAGSSSGERISETPSAAESLVTTSATTAWNSGLEAESDSLSTKTDFVDRLVEAAAVDDLQRAAGVAGLGVGGVEGLGADHAAERDGDEHEGEPPEDRDLPVGGAPAAHAGCEVLGLGERGHGFLS